MVFLKAMTRPPVTVSRAALLALLIVNFARAEEWKFKDEFLPQVVDRIPEILKSQDKSTGKFGTGVWICRDQEPIYPLAVAWSIDSPKNPYFHDPKLLEAIMASGDVLIAEQTPQGQWIFRKKDNSTW